MEISMKTQIIITLYAIIVGAVIGIIYDVVRISRVFSGVTETSSQTQMYAMKLPLIGTQIERKNDFLKFCGFGTEKFYLKKKNKQAKKRNGIVSGLYKNAVVFMGDILFFFIVSPIFAVFIYHANNGRIRWYLVTGAVLGFIFYYFTAGRVIMFFSGAIVFAIRSAGAYALYFTLRPLVLFIRLILRITWRTAAKISHRIRNAVLYKRMKRHTERAERSVALIAKADF